MTATFHPVISPKKLIEVALPLDAINVAAKEEKSVRHGNPANLHRWWARRPLASARAVIFGQLVHDPEDLWRCQNPGKEPVPQNKAAWTKARTRLFKIIEDLVLWENTTNETVLNAAREAIRESWRQTCELNKSHPQAAELFNPDRMPGLHDPFAGGGAIPLEAQRLGLEAYASDLNPVAVLINKAMIEIPPKFAGRPPVHPAARKSKQLIAPEWKGAAGLAEDVRRYGQWMRDEAEKRIGHLYPKVTITKEMVAERPDLKPLLCEELTVISWLWARTVKSPNPAFAHVDVPLASSFILSSKDGKEAFVQPVIEKAGYSFEVKVGKPPADAKSGTKLARGANFKCLMSNGSIAPDYIKAEAMAGRMGARLMAIVAEGARGRVYLTPQQEHVAAAQAARIGDCADSIHVQLADDPRAIWCVNYGLTHYDHLFTPRQLVALTTFSDLVGEARDLIRRDAIAAGLPDDDLSLECGGTCARAYADGIACYLSLVVSKTADSNNSLCPWEPVAQCSRQMFGRQAIPMLWDFAEANPLHDSSGGLTTNLDVSTRAYAVLPARSDSAGIVVQADAAKSQTSWGPRFFCTDPPYYDNIGYADLSDFFYVWLRRSLRGSVSGIVSTIAVPKADELVASPYRHGGAGSAEGFFLNGMTEAMRHLASQAHPAAPTTIYYAFKQSDTESDGTNSTGWETFLGAVISAGLQLTGTWPMRTELTAALKSKTNSLASSVVLVCRPRQTGSGAVSRRQFVRMLNEKLPAALDAMTRSDEGEHSPVAPVDLSQAIIGPGMAIFSRYDAVLEADGSPMSVKTALQLINRFLAEDDFDADTQFCLSWFEQHGWEEGKFGEADILARAKGTSVDGVKQAGVAEAGGGSVRLLRWKEYAADWDPASDVRLPVWEALHQLIRAYNTKGDAGAAKVLAETASQAEAMRQLAYRLYTVCERKGRADDARAYNEVVTGWTGIETAASKASAEVQGQLFDN
jgi:putative DNA methylase